MHYYQFHIGDYRAATAHLSNEEDLAYRRLLDMYYDTEQGIPLDTQWVARRLRIKSEIIETVLSDFFVRTDDGWMHSKCDEVIEHFHATSRRNRINGMRGGRPKETQSVSGGLPAETQDEPTSKATNNHKPITKNHKPEAETYSPDFDEIWEAYPKRPGASKKGAFRAYKTRIKSGAEHADILEGVKRYAAFVTASGTQPQFIKTPEAFLGPDEHFRSDWTPQVSTPIRYPSSKPTTDDLLAHNLAVGERWLREST